MNHLAYTSILFVICMLCGTIDANQTVHSTNSTSPSPPDGGSYNNAAAYVVPIILVLILGLFLFLFRLYYARKKIAEADQNGTNYVPTNNVTYSIYENKRRGNSRAVTAANDERSPSYGTCGTSNGADSKPACGNVNLAYDDTSTPKYLTMQRIKENDQPSERAQNAYTKVKLKSEQSAGIRNEASTHTEQSSKSVNDGTYAFADQPTNVATLETNDAGTVRPTEQRVSPEPLYSQPKKRADAKPAQRQADLKRRDSHGVEIGTVAALARRIEEANPPHAATSATGDISGRREITAQGHDLKKDHTVGSESGETKNPDTTYELAKPFPCEAPNTGTENPYEVADKSYDLIDGRYAMAENTEDSHHNEGDTAYEVPVKAPPSGQGNPHKHISSAPYEMADKGYEVIDGKYTMAGEACEGEGDEITEGAYEPTQFDGCKTGESPYAMADANTSADVPDEDDSHDHSTAKIGKLAKRRRKM